MKLIEGKFEKAMAYCKKEFGGDFFSFELSASQGELSGEFDRFLSESSETLRFKNEYRGNVVIDLSAWNKNDTNKVFDAFMYFIKDRLNIYNCIFIVDKVCSDELLKKLKEFFEITEINLEPREKLVASSKRIGFEIPYENKEERNTNVRG